MGPSQAKRIREMKRNGDCDIFPVCVKILEGVGNQIVAEPCDGCPHWHERPWVKPSFSVVQEAIETIQDWLQDEDGKAILIEADEMKLLEKSEYEK